MDSLTQRLRMTTASDAANMPTTVRDDCHAAAARIAALEAKLAERVKVKPLKWLEVPALNGGRKLLAFDLHSREHARLDLKGHTDDEIEDFKARHQQAYDRSVLSAIEATPPAPKVTATTDHDPKLGTTLHLMKQSWESRQPTNSGAPKVTEEMVDGPTVIKGEVRIRKGTPYYGGFTHLHINGVEYTSDQVRSALEATPPAPKGDVPHRWECAFPYGSIFVDTKAAADVHEAQGAKITPLYVSPSAPKMTATHRHKKRGSEYRVLGQAQVQCSDGLTDYEVVTVYVGTDGEMWVRRKSEFEDGRFEAITAAQEAGKP